MLAILEWLLLILEVLCCLLLVGVILLQKSRSEGLGMAFGASMGESLFGARATNVLTRITIWLGAIFLVNTTLLAMLYAHRSGMTPAFETGAPIEQPAGAPMAGPDGLPGQPMSPAGALPGPALPAAPVPAASFPADAPAPVMPAAPAPLALPVDAAPPAPALPAQP